jgi:4,5-dihydroxyphthalate decarboxylase
LLDKTADCLMTEGTPMIAEEERNKLVRLHRDIHALQRDYYRRTGFHTIVHVIVIREEILQERPDLAVELCQAFDEAKAHGYRTLQNERMTALPLMRNYIDETVEIFGLDPWPYGLENNFSELDRFLAHTREQGLTQKRLGPEDLFAPSARNFRFRATMDRTAC